MVAYRGSKTDHPFDALLVVSGESKCCNLLEFSLQIIVINYRVCGVPGERLSRKEFQYVRLSRIREKHFAKRCAMGRVAGKRNGPNAQLVLSFGDGYIQDLSINERADAGGLLDGPR